MIRQQSFTNGLSILYVIATPIGNLSEITSRTIEALNDSVVVFCEDTRVSGNLLKHLNIHKPLISAYENIEKMSSEKVIDYLKNGNNVAFMSDAGYPGISDPGQLIIQEVIKNNFNVVIVNGPCAMIHSLIASGFSTDHFYFHGFLNAKQTTRIKELEELKSFKHTMIFYQSPHKLQVCLEDMLTVLGDREICLCRELTKKFEEFIRGKISEVIPLIDTLKGEMVIVVKKQEEVQIKYEIDENMISEVNQLVDDGYHVKEAINKIADKYNVSKKELYQIYHNGGK